MRNQRTVRQATLLVVDDEPLNLPLLSARLERAGNCGGHTGQRSAPATRPGH